LQGRSVAAFRIEHIITMAPFTYFHFPLPITNTTLPYYTVVTILVFNASGVAFLMRDRASFRLVTSPAVDPSIAAADSIVMDWAAAVACNTFIDRSCC